MAEKIICVVGPTACGKTKLGVLLAKRYDGRLLPGRKLNPPIDFQYSIRASCLL